MASRKRKAVLDLSQRQLCRLINENRLNENASSPCVDIPVQYSDTESSSNGFLINLAANKDLSETISKEKGSVDDIPQNMTIEINNDHFFDDSDYSYDNFTNTESTDNLANNTVDISIQNETSKYSIQSFHADLSCWATKNKIKRGNVSELLVILKKYDVLENIPRDSRSLLKTPRSTKIRPVPPGHYYHCNFHDTILQYIEADYSEFKYKEIRLKIGIDGLPICDSSSSQLWPILGSVYPSKKVFLIGVYHGYSKPTDSNEFLQDFVEDITDLINSGLIYKGILFKVSIFCIVADAPAKSFITKTKGHTGYFSCTKCEQEGDFVNSRMCFPLNTCRKRTKQSFIAQENIEYHMGKSILSDIPSFDIVSDIPLDYMHLVCIGVVKKLISLWIKGPLHVRLAAATIKIISTRLINIKPLITTEFARRPQEIINFSNWKATELRQFLLYTGPVVLFKVLPSSLYNHFLTLHIAIRIFCSKNQEKNNLQYAHELIHHFIESFVVLYGKEFVSHNIHGLIHLKDDVEHLGVLDSYSAFPFENFMKILKSYISKPEKPLQQIHRRYAETEKAGGYMVHKEDNSTTSTPKNLYHSDGPLLSNFTFGQQLRHMKIKNYLFKIKSPDNCCLLHGTVIVEIHNIAYNNESRSFNIIGKKYLTVKDLYKKPCLSTNVSCFYVDNLSNTLGMWPTSLINAKCLRLPHVDGFAVFPLLHD